MDTKQQQLEAGDIRRVAMRGGSLCLDFHNHLRRIAQSEVEPPEAWQRVLEWSVQAGVLDAHMTATMQDSVGEAERAALLRQLRRQWQTLHAILLAIARGTQPDAESLHVFNAELGAALRHARVAPAVDGFSWSWSGDEGEPRRLLWPIMRSAAELLTSGDLDRLRICDNADCGWLFVDRSRNRSRRWCDMQDCGNVAKVRRFRERQRAAN